MTIDEMISKLKIEYEEQKDTVAYLETQEEHAYDIEPHRQAIIACEQLVEWLEELKEYKANNHPKCSECAGCTQWLCDCSNVRNKAIDDFTEKATKIVYEANDRDRNPQPRDMVADIHYKLIELAEQLKEGSADNE